MYNSVTIIPLGEGGWGIEKGYFNKTGGVFELMTVNAYPCICSYKM